MSAFAASPELMARGAPGSQGGTYGGNAVACAAALATLEVVDDEGLVDTGGAWGSGCCDGRARASPREHP
ncbi:MAG: aminotransferase class III-fold pyridoxal phosphate-dependent enzyme [Acidimicrobiia bacterium]|nr:aminotransferase class III-fold pyridoxal phosphate-dependent enzyme [Acidimicrobiia bacterium]